MISTGPLALLFLVALPARFALAGMRHWTTSGPAVPVVRITSLAVDRLSPGTVYAGTDSNSLPGNASIYVSANAGSTWSKIFGQILEVTAIAVDPSLPANVHAGTGLCHFRIGCSGNLYRSEDVGYTWVQSSTLGYVTALAVDPSPSVTVYASVVRSFPIGPSVGPEITVGLRSTDRGQSWTEIASSFPSARVSQFLFDPTQAGVIYVSSLDGVFKSVDDGLTWNRVAMGLASLRVSALAASAGSTATLYAGTDAGLFRSSDGAASWFSTGYSDSVTAVVVNPRDPRNIFVASSGLGVFESRDGADTWAAINSGLTSFSIYGLVLDSSGVLHASSEGGVFDFSLRGSMRVISFR